MLPESFEAHHIVAHPPLHPLTPHPNSQPEPPTPNLARQYTPGETAVNDVMVPIPFNPIKGEAESSHEPPSIAVLRLHHYRTKSREHARWRFEVPP